MQHNGRLLVYHIQDPRFNLNLSNTKPTSKAPTEIYHMRTQQIGTTYELESGPSPDVQSSSLTFDSLASVVYKLSSLRYFLRYFVIKV